jgi:hypothetical protein
MVVNAVTIVFKANSFRYAESVVMRDYISGRITTFTAKPDFLKRRGIFFV